MANSLISMVKGDSTLIDNTEVLNGQILFDETKQKIFLDDNTKRKEYGGSDDNAVKKDDVAYVESAMVATRGYSAGNYIIVQDTLYKATTQINSGTALVVGTNVSTTTVGNELTQLNSDLINKVTNSARVSNSILDINGSDFSLQGKVKNSQHEFFAIVAYDTDKLSYLHTADGTTWNTIWEISPTTLTTQVGKNTTDINTPVNIGVTSVDTSKFIDQGYSYAKALNNGHLVNVSLVYRITASNSNDITIARLGNNYPTSVAFGSCCISYTGGDYGAYPVYIDIAGYIHIQLDGLRTFSNSLLALNMSYLR